MKELLADTVFELFYNMDGETLSRVCLEFGTASEEFIRITFGSQRLRLSRHLMRVYDGLDKGYRGISYYPDGFSFDETYQTLNHMPNNKSAATLGDILNFINEFHMIDYPGGAK